MAVYATANLNFGRGWRAHRRDIRAALRDVDVLAVQELRRPMGDVMRRVARTVQPRRSPREPGSEAVVVARHRGVEVLRRGSIRASHNQFGQAIGPRRLVWALLDDPDAARPILFVCYHRAPLRMQDSPLDEAQDARLRRLVEWAEHEGWEWVVAGDMNQLERADPAGLEHRYGGTWHGRRIDLICVSPGLQVVQEWAKQDPHRRDGHPLVAVTVKEK